MCPECENLASQSIQMAHMQLSRLFTTVGFERAAQPQQWERVGHCLVSCRVWDVGMWGCCVDKHVFPQAVQQCMHFRFVIRCHSQVVVVVWVFMTGFLFSRGVIAIDLISIQVKVLHAHASMLLETEASSALSMTGLPGQHAVTRAAVWRALSCLKEWHSLELSGLSTALSAEEVAQITTLEKWANTCVMVVDEGGDLC